MQRKGSKRILFLPIGFTVVLLLMGCSRMKEKEYYENIQNYITEEAVVENIKYNEEYEYIKFRLSGIDEKYQDSDFIIKGKSVELVLENKIMDKIMPGDTITYTSAPAYFGNSYCMPIVELFIGETIILGFEEGYKNLLDLY